MRRGFRGERVLKKVLHVGCGGSSLPFYLQHCQEVRLDIDPATQPDIVADMTHLPPELDGEFDAVFTCHSLEHLYPHDVDTCLRGFHRVLKPGGSVIVFVPDLEGLTPTDDVLYVSPSGPVTAFDLFYGYRPWIRDNPFMAHKCGFVQKTLTGALERAGFAKVEVKRLSSDLVPFNLFGFGIKGE